MASVIPVQAVANQQLSVQLEGQAVQLSIFTMLGALFMSVSVNNSVIISSVICENKNRIVRDAYLGFLGDFCWLDTQGDLDPYYAELGSRFQLIYLSETDVPTEVT